MNILPNERERKKERQTDRQTDRKIETVSINLLLYFAEMNN